MGRMIRHASHRQPITVSLTMTSVEEKVHEEFARQKSDSRNQDPANPIP
jgi:hypothetical protein